MVVILAAILLEAISGFQYYYTRGMLERNLEQQILTGLTISAYRMDGIMNGAATSVYNQVWNAERHLDDPDFMETLVYNLVYNESDMIIGAAIGFRPYFYPQKGYWYELYARQWSDSISVTQIGSAQHDYFSREIYQTAIKGDTLKWSVPYLDNEGAKDMVSTFALPIRDEQGEPIGILGVDINTEWISETVNAIKMHPSSFTMVLSQEGELIARAPDSLCSAKQAQKIVDMINDSTVKKETKINGRATGFDFYNEEKDRFGRVYYSRKRMAPQWFLATVCYDDEAFGELDRMRRSTMWLALAGLVVLGLIIHLFAKGRNKLQQSQMKQQRIDGELQIARDIQNQMLPRENSIKRDDISLHGSLTPAREVGGDLYDFFIRDEKLFFCIGDVSGKGVPSAMLMAVTHSLFRIASLRENNPGLIMQAINRIVCQNNESSMFVTFFIGVLDLPTGRLHYCDAGHDSPIVLKDGVQKALTSKPNIPLGVFDDARYMEEESTLEPGAMLFLYTDGLTEARRSRRNFFGLERVKATLQQQGESPSLSPQSLIQHMTEEVNRFVEGQDQSDDLTMLALVYTPVREKDLLNETLTLQNDPEQVTLLSDFLKGIAKRLNMERKTAYDTRLAVEEAVVNVMSYAYPAGQVGQVIVEAKYDGQRLKFVISDRGVAFDPTRAASTDTTLKAEERPLGGLGILLVRKLADGINYERIDGMNVLTIWKTLNAKV